MIAMKIEERVHRLEREVVEIRRSIERRDAAPASRNEVVPEGPRDRAVEPVLPRPSKVRFADRSELAAAIAAALEEMGMDRSVEPISPRELGEQLRALVSGRTASTVARSSKCGR